MVNAMIELKSGDEVGRGKNTDELWFQFPEVHPNARLRVAFHRTLRIPDDGTHYSLPPGLGHFPLRHVDDFKDTPRGWLEHGGVMLPMYQSEALWLSFDAQHVSAHGVDYPFAIKIAAGKINAITGDGWDNALGRKKQDYVVAPEQPWLDGYCVERGVIRQFVAMPLGDGYSAEEQITGEAEHGGLQILVRPMKREAFERHFPKQTATLMRSRSAPASAMALCSSAMGLAPGGTMKQEIYDDPFDYEDWSHDTHSRCFVHIANSLSWRAITGAEPPPTPITAKEYTRAGLPWFDYYADGKALEGSSALGKLKSVFKLGEEKGKSPLPENESVEPKNVIELREGLKKDQVREGSF